MEQCEAPFFRALMIEIKEKYIINGMGIIRKIGPPITTGK
jgi:hypothetical protein